MRFTVILFPWQKYNYFQYTRNFATLFIFHHPSTTRTGTRWFPWRLRLPSGETYVLKYSKMAKAIEIMLLHF